jgi:hypothetical protein
MLKGYNVYAIATRSPTTNIPTETLFGTSRNCSLDPEKVTRTPLRPDGYEAPEQLDSDAISLRGARTLTKF